VWGLLAIRPRRASTVLLIVPSSVLSGGSPRRLFLHAGKWILEVVRHVNLGQDLIRPTTQRLTGQRAIASYFKNNPDKAQLAKATQRLMQSGHEGEAFSYTVEGVDWVANSTPPPRGDRLDSYPAPAEPKTIETRVGAADPPRAPGGEAGAGRRPRTERCARARRRPTEARQR
jgi:hypothetical protein